MIWIVSGATSSGKSTFLASPRAREVTGLPPTTRVWFPKEVGVDAPPPGEDAFVHYNILRPFQHEAQPQHAPIDDATFSRDPAWLAIAALAEPKRAVILVAGRDALVERIRARTVIEDGEERRYGVERWLRIVRAVDLDALHAAWRAELTRRGIAFVEIDGAARP